MELRHAYCGGELTRLKSPTMSRYKCQTCGAMLVIGSYGLTGKGRRIVLREAKRALHWHERGRKP